MDDAPACVGRGTPLCGEKPVPSDAPASMGGLACDRGSFAPVGRTRVVRSGGRGIGVEGDFVLALAPGGAAMP